MGRFKQVSQAEFEAFLKKYPHPVTPSILEIGKPPLIQYNDFRLGSWPISVIAYHPVRMRKKNDYWILVEYI